MTSLRLVLAAAFASCLTTSALAQTIVLDFEGLANGASVGSYYAGGPGGNLGITFGSSFVAGIDADAGGTAGIANEPSASTVIGMSPTPPVKATIDLPAGFTTGFSFYYSSLRPGSVSVYDGLGGTGNLLGTVALTRQFDTACSGDPNGTFCNWTAAGISFAGTARSVNIDGVIGSALFDNLTFGSATPTVVTPIPEPGTYALMLLGLGVVGAMAHRRRHRVPV